MVSAIKLWLQMLEIILFIYTSKIIHDRMWSCLWFILWLYKTDVSFFIKCLKWHLPVHLLFLFKAWNVIVISNVYRMKNTVYPVLFSLFLFCFPKAYWSYQVFVRFLCWYTNLRYQGNSSIIISLDFPLTHTPKSGQCHCIYLKKNTTSPQ